MLKYDCITLEHEGRYTLFWNLTLRDLSLSVATYDERSLEYDTSVHDSNKRTYLKFVSSEDRDCDLKVIIWSLT